VTGDGVSHYFQPEIAWLLPGRTRTNCIISPLWIDEQSIRLDISICRGERRLIGGVRPGVSEGDAEEGTYPPQMKAHSSNIIGGEHRPMPFCGRELIAIHHPPLPV
jgi:hypothetical protein